LRYDDLAPRIADIGGWVGGCGHTIAVGDRVAWTGRAWAHQQCDKTEQRCERSDLPVSMCAHCRGLDHVPTPIDDDPFDAPSDLGPTIAAKFDSECGNCGDPIAVGEPITSAYEGWVHERCAE
jgi:hypothetical protein